MVKIKNKDILVAVKTILLSYKDSKVKSIRLFTEKTLKLLPLKQ